MFALGASGPGSPQFIAGQAQTGSALGDAVRGIGRVGSAQVRSKIPTLNPLQQRLAQLQIENAEVNLASDKLDLTEKQRNLSDNQLVTQSAASSQEIPRLDEQQRNIVTPGVPVKREGYQEISLMIPGGKRIIIGRSATAEDIEDIFGDLAGALYMIPKGLESIYLTIKHNAKQKGYGPKFDAMIDRAYAKHNETGKYKKITKTQAFRNYADRVAPTPRKRF